MEKYIFLRITASRLLGALMSIFGASLIAFALLRIVPGDPARLVLGPFASQEAVDALANEMGFNESIPAQYIIYLRDFFTGDWGFSYSTGDTVISQFGSRFPATIELGLLAFFFAVIGALALALLATYRSRPLVDTVVNSIAYLGLGLPQFWFALILLILFFERAGWFPGPEGRLSEGVVPPPSVTRLYSIDAIIAVEFDVFANALWHLVLPAAALGFLSMAFLIRLLRANLWDVSREPFLVVARSKGIGRFTAFRRHALPNAILPTLTAGGLVFAQLLGGSVLVEKVFNWPGIGATVTDSILRQDFAVVQAFILLSACLYVVASFVVDMLYGVLDPRVREKSAVE